MKLITDHNARVRRQIRINMDRMRNIARQAVVDGSDLAQLQLWQETAVMLRNQIA